MDHSVYIWLLWAMFIVVIFLSRFYYTYFLFDIRHFQFNVTSFIFQKRHEMTKDWITRMWDFDELIIMMKYSCRSNSHAPNSVKNSSNHNPIFLNNRIIFAIDFNSLPQVFFMHHHVVQFTRHKLRFLLQM